MDALGEELPDCSLTHDEIRQIDATIDRVKNSNDMNNSDEALEDLYQGIYINFAKNNNISNHDEKANANICVI